MAAVLIRGLTRGCHHRSIALQKFYSTKPFPKPSTDDGASKPEPAQPKPKSATKQDSPSPATDERLSGLRTRIEESQTKVENVGNNLRGYALDRFINYVKNYEQLLEKKFPGAMKVYRVFMDGVKYFYRDMVSYLKIRSRMVIKGQHYDEMTRRELEIYLQMPDDIRKVWPILIISAIPFAHYVTMPVAYMYPRHFLTQHFWTLQQRSEFAVMNLRDRLAYNRSVFRKLQNKLETLKNDRHYDQWAEILGKLGSGVHPTTQEIINIKGLFAEPPYKTTSLSYPHVKYLAGLHGTRSTFFHKSKLSFRAMCMHNIDMAIKREGGPQNMPTETLRDACFSRGLNASNLTNDELIKFLDDWIEVSAHIDQHNFSLFLHLPILLTYNHPNNWKLIYQER